MSWGNLVLRVTRGCLAAGLDEMLGVRCEPDPRKPKEMWGPTFVRERGFLFQTGFVFDWV